MKLDGFVVSPPSLPQDDEDKVIPHLSHHTFGCSPTEAWMRLIGYPYDRMRVNDYIDRGYRLRRATIEILDEIGVE